MSKFLIYGLRCPITNNCRYIGQSSIGMERPKQHLNHSHSDLINAWVNFLKQKGERPIIDVLEICDSESELNEKERWWIDFFEKLGLSLFNSQLTNNTDAKVYSLDAVSRIDFNIGSTIRQRRIMIGMSTTELANISNIDRTTLYNIEKGNSKVGWGTVKKVAEAIGLRFGIMSKSENKRNVLWLDDTRDPNDSELAYGYYDDNIIWVRSYEDFINEIKRNMPDIISFDYDLGEDVAINNVKNGMSKKDARRLKKQVKNGKDCAEWLVNYCKSNKINIPRINVHSQNRKGCAGIFSVIDDLI